MDRTEKNIYIIGFMCSGKTTTGRRLAALLNRPFVDSDGMVERAAGRSISAIVENKGLGEFRRLEAAAVNKIAARAGKVVALGGGVYPSRRWRGLLQRTGTTVFLDCGWAELEARLSKARASRPLLAGGAAAALRRAQGLLARRRKYYNLADIRLAVAGLTPRGAAALAKDRLGTVL